MSALNYFFIALTLMGAALAHPVVQEPILLPPMSDSEIALLFPMHGPDGLLAEREKQVQPDDREWAFPFQGSTTTSTTEAPGPKLLPPIVPQSKSKSNRNKFEPHENCLEQVDFDNICILRNTKSAYYFDNNAKLCRRFVPCDGNKKEAKNFFWDFDDCRQKCEPLARDFFSFVNARGQCNGPSIGQATRDDLELGGCLDLCTEREQCKAVRFSTIKLLGDFGDGGNKTQGICQLFSSCEKLKPELSGEGAQTWVLAPPEQ